MEPSISLLRSTDWTAFCLFLLDYFALPLVCQEEAHNHHHHQSEKENTQNRQVIFKNFLGNNLTYDKVNERHKDFEKQDLIKKAYRAQFVGREVCL